MFALYALTAVIIASWPVLGFPNGLKKRQDVSTETTFRKWSGCSSTEKKQIRQAHKDALDLASAPLFIQHELQDEHWAIDFRTEAAHDYWGPQSKNSPYEAHILNTLVRASSTSRGWGWSDYWSDRYVDVHCDDPSNACSDDSPAYQISGGKGYPIIAYCPVFFSKLESHGTMVKQVKNDKTGDMKKNTRNLRSRATTALHEWLHITGSSAECCTGGCKDYRIKVGNEKVKAYKSGRTKLLAARDPKTASQNNDNYAYFATAVWMKNEFGTYPRYPRIWNGAISPQDNRDNEAEEPGAPSSIQSWELEDHGAADDETEDADVVDGDMLSVIDYPEWYRPVLYKADSTIAPDISVPDLPDLDWAVPTSNLTCETSDDSPDIEDCVHAFGSLYNFPDNDAVQGEKGGTYWAGYVHSCAVAIYYTEDWTDSCKAKLGDVAAHASDLFVACQDGGKGKVGGNVKFSAPDCPAYVQIMNTDGQKPQRGEAPD